VKTFEEYEQVALQTALYPNRGENLVYPTLGLAGESGEFAEKVKKVLRDHDGDYSKPELKQAMVKELGDVLWYVTACSRELGVTLEQVAKANAEKLLSRRDRGQIHGNGDDR
jgi:NTP pyrophosphatase (non-canonical NTP hydrolase)